MSYPFVTSYHDAGIARGPRLGFTWHMAEGGGTVGYLHHANPNGVSVHYVIEGSGAIVQMLLETHMHTSIRIRYPDGRPALRRDTDADGFYGALAAQAVLGNWAYVDHTLGPNHATIACELEGFAAEGPNDAQVAAMILLAADVRSRYPTIRNLGHRDHNIKACPGRHIPWSSIGGHAARTDMLFEFTADDRRGILRFDKVTAVRDAQTGERSELPAGTIRRARAFVRAPELGGAGWLIGNDGGRAQFVGLTVAPELEPWPDDAPLPAPDPDIVVTQPGVSVPFTIRVTAP